MKKYWFILVFILGLLILQMYDAGNHKKNPPEPISKLVVSSPVAIAIPSSLSSSDQGIKFQVSDTPAAKNMMRLGMNMASWTSFGPQQYMNNIIQNPGFEAQIDRILCIVSSAAVGNFSDTQQFNFFGDDYWKDATFDVRSGKSAGYKGMLTSSLQSGTDGNCQYFYDQTTSKDLALEANDVVIISKTLNPNPVNFWFIQGDSTSKLSVDPNNARPGSPGTQSLLFVSSNNNPTELNNYMDSMSTDEGIGQKFINIDGSWTFSFWAKAEKEGVIFQYAFMRLNGTAPFFATEIALSTDWKEYTIDFNGVDDGSIGPLKLRLAAVSQNETKTWLDDVTLKPSNQNSAWRKTVVEMLKEMKVSYLRDWQGQLGDTWANRIAPQEGRKLFSYRAGGRTDITYAYSIPEILELCKLVGANPWLIIPPSLSDEELHQFGQFLVDNANTSEFSEVVLEFGNENWNWTYRACGLPYPFTKAHGDVADRAFQKITDVTGTLVKIKKTINGQVAGFQETLNYAADAPGSDTMALGPYFFDTQNAGIPNDDTMNALYSQANPGDLYKNFLNGLKDYKKDLTVYEINLHTTGGNALNEDRNAVVAGACSGCALAKRLLYGYLNGIQPQCIYSFSQQASGVWDVPGIVLLWGVTNNLTDNNRRYRPTGLAVVMLNKAAEGDVYPVTSTETDKVLMVGFQKDEHWKFAAVSQISQPQTITLQLPSDGRTMPNTLYYMDYNWILDNNEHAENVKISSKPITINENNTITCTIPGWGMIVLDHVLTK